MGAKKLGEVLVQENLISPSQLKQAKKRQKEDGGSLISALIRSTGVSEKYLAKRMSDAHGIPLLDLSQFEVSSDVIKLIPKTVCLKYNIFPVQKVGQVLVVAFSDPLRLFVKDDLALITHCKIQPVIDTESNIKNAIDRYYFYSRKQMERAASEILLNKDVNEEKDDPLVKFVDAMMNEAIKLSASDIHIEPYEKKLRIRFRIDGILQERILPPSNISAALVSRIKVMSNMDISEKRLPQDGRMKFKMRDGEGIDLRVSSLPMLFGEKIVMRILDKSNLQVNLEKLGFEKADLDLFIKKIYAPQGMILITGPTGSGKTTTIYSALDQRNVTETNVSTAEDPVEFNLDGINQVQVNPEIGFTYAKALKAFLRQDPEVIMVGEIRDSETASIAYKAASTGHLVMSTLHTNDTAATVSRLLDIGVEPFIVADTTSMIVAQRLLKKNCSNCLQECVVNEETLLSIGVKEKDLKDYNNLKISEGCGVCNYTGLKGRVAVFEVMTITLQIREAILKKALPIEIKKSAIASGMTSLRGAALLKLKAGLVTVKEVLHSTLGEDE